jgi:hypothetical protein
MQAFVDPQQQVFRTGACSCCLLQLSTAVALAGDAAAAPQWGVSTTTTRRSAAAWPEMHRGGRPVKDPIYRDSHSNPSLRFA